MSSNKSYDNSDPYDDRREDRRGDTPVTHWLGYGLAILLMLLLGILIGSCFGPERTIEVTRIVPGEATEIPVTVVVNEEIEVTRVVSEAVVTEVPVTRIVNETVEVTRIVPEERVIELPATRIVREVEEIVVTKIIPIPPEVTVTPGNGRGCTRFDLEIGRNQVDGTPEDGIYLMQELSGHQLATWTAKQGWLDSGWLRNLPLSRSEVHVQVFFYPADGGGPIPLEILNPAPSSANGWLADDVCHAVEIQFPE